MVLQWQFMRHSLSVPPVHKRIWIMMRCAIVNFCIVFIEWLKIVKISHLADPHWRLMVFKVRELSAQTGENALWKFTRNRWKCSGSHDFKIKHINNTHTHKNINAIYIFYVFFPHFFKIFMPVDKITNEKNRSTARYLKLYDLKMVFRWKFAHAHSRCLTWSLSEEKAKQNAITKSQFHQMTSLGEKNSDQTQSNGKYLKSTNTHKQTS